MPRRSGRTRRSPLEWALRGALAATAVAVGYVGSAYSVAQASRTTNVERAFQVTPGNAQIRALYAQSLSGPQASSADRNRADGLARDALRRDPTTVVAASALGINAQARGDVAAARRFFAYAEALSRRDMQTQLWAIEDAVAREDVPGALRHYDIALRTSPAASNLLFPILGSAIEDDAVRAALLQTLVRGTSWTPHFINFVAGQGSEPKAAAKLFAALDRAGVPASPEAKASLVNNLVYKGFYPEAWAYYAANHRGVSSTASRDPHFRADAEKASLFDWTPIDAAGITASLRAGEGGGVDFTASPSVSGPVVQQMQMLLPGDYVLQGRSRDIDQAPDARPYWVLQCYRGRELGRVTLANSAEGQGRFAGRFTVPADCPVQILALVAVPSSAMSGLTGTIEQVELRRP
ncbi:hypothetical protein MZO42_13625 [Sphingomonas psychrotolerans]|uniref:Tetratricopeptide repeat protein n=1 Tax=Sphingomonas psychrotolerans TaxID=1327635 RepID=A0ABU3N7I5_9SPHN|nr:hypothetical protein [Sphingomonas psychrotolerans]MDT8759737.1 hypothetical protein [Sphingomonas psychrotolerans]